MGEVIGDSSYLVGLRVGEDGDLRLAVGDVIVEIELGADERPVALREIHAVEADEADFGPWQESGQLD